MSPLQWTNRLEQLLKQPLERSLPDLVVETEIIDSWSALEFWLDNLNFGEACFRGHKRFEYPLQPSIERAVFVEWESKDKLRQFTGPIEIGYHEQKTLWQFRRGAHHFLPHVPEQHETLDWLALMQHHGAPTRLLDWSVSPYVALFFALEDSAPHDAAMWAIDRTWIMRRSASYIPIKDLEEARLAINKAINSCSLKTPIVALAEPKQLNQRMMAQQGLFLAALWDEVNFTNSLASMLDKPKELLPVVSKIRVKKHCRTNFLGRLRQMNIHH